MNLDFLKDVQLETVKTTAPAARTKKVRLPENADIRVFSNGQIYPSKAFADANNLEFTAKDAVKGNGMDIFPSTEWAMLSALPEKVIFGAVVPKDEAKVDVWGSTKYDEKGEPKASVLTQGSATFGKNRLVPMLADCYDIDWENTDYVDLKFLTDTPMVSPNGIYIVPKIVSAGPKKGEPTYIRRENLNICPLVVVDSEADPIPTTPEEVVASAQGDEVPAIDEAADPVEAEGKGWSRANMES